MTVTKLAEYLAAGPLRRREIIREQRRPRNFITTRYARAEAAAIEYVVSGGEPRVLDRELQRLRELQPRTQNDRVSRDCCVAALEALPAALALVDLTGAQVRATARLRQQPLHIGGLIVSVRPELVVLAPGRRRPAAGGAGGLKLYFSKDHPLDGTAGRHLAGEYGAWLVREYLRTSCPHFVDGRPVQADHCAIVDVFAQRVFVAPRAEVTCRRVLEVSCEEIARGWYAR